LEKDTKHVEAILDADDEIRRIRQSAQKTIGEITKLKTEKGDMATGAEILLAFLILQTHDESDDALDLLEVCLPHRRGDMS
jgi:DNA polymerase phi